MKKTDKTCLLCGKTKSIFSFHVHYREEIKDNVYVCHGCEISIINKVIDQHFKDIAVLEGNWFPPNPEQEESRLAIYGDSKREQEEGRMFERKIKEPQKNSPEAILETEMLLQEFRETMQRVKMAELAEAMGLTIEETKWWLEKKNNQLK